MAIADHGLAIIRKGIAVCIGRDGCILNLVCDYKANGLSGKVFQAVGKNRFQCAADSVCIICAAVVIGNNIAKRRVAPKIIDPALEAVKSKLG